MIKVGQAYQYNDGYSANNAVFKIDYMNENLLVLVGSKGVYEYKKYWLEDEIQDGKAKLIRDVPSAEEKLEELGWKIEREYPYVRFTCINSIFKELKSEVVYDEYLISLSTNEYGVSTPELKLILQYIEEKE